MSVIVKGMDMPFSCYECPLVHRAFNGVETELFCYILEKAVSDEDSTRDDECPLVGVTVPHGRLVEFIDVITKVNEDDGTEEVCVGDVFKAYYEMKNATTVIEAEE